MHSKNLFDSAIIPSSAGMFGVSRIKLACLQSPRRFFFSRDFYRNGILMSTYMNFLMCHRSLLTKCISLLDHQEFHIFSRFREYA